MNLKKRVGITTDIERRKREHLADYPSMTNFVIERRGLTRGEAENWEAMQRTLFGHEGHGGGRTPNDPWLTWYCYSFYYDQTDPRNLKASTILEALKKLEKLYQP